MNSSIKLSAGRVPCLCITLWLASSVVTAGFMGNRHGPSPVTPDTAPYQGIAQLDLEQMAEMRGGFSMGGLDLNFGATISTVIDNIQLSTVFNITSEGAQVVSQALRDLGSINEVIAALSQQGSTRQSSGANIVNGPAADVTLASGTPSASQPSVPVTQPAAAPTPASTASQAPVVQTPTPTPASPTPVVQAPSTQPAAAQTPVAQPTTAAASPTSSQPAQTPSTATLVNPGDGTLADLAPVGVKLDGVDTPSGFSGLAVTNNKGFTAAVHKLTQSAAISAVISNASHQRISQKLELSVKVQNVKSIREAAMRSRLSRIADGGL